MMNRPVPSSDKKGSSGRARTYNPQVNSDAGSTRQVIDFATPRSFSKLGRAQDSVNYFYDYLSLPLNSDGPTDPKTDTRFSALWFWNFEVAADLFGKLLVDFAMTRDS
jgi:hypothetical protein